MSDFVRRWRSLSLPAKFLAVTLGFATGIYTWVPFFEEIKRQQQLEEQQTSQQK